MATDKKQQQLIDFERTSARHTEETRDQLKQFPFGTPPANRPAPPQPASPDQGNEVKK